MGERGAAERKFVLTGRQMAGRSSNIVGRVRRAPVEAIWMGSALSAAVAVSAATLVVAGAAKPGTVDALLVTARLSFLLFWPAYVGSALPAVFGTAFQPLARHARDFGLAFAAAQLVHLGLVGWLCQIGATPSVKTFVFFGTAAIFTYLLMALSLNGLRHLMSAKQWGVLRLVGMNFIALAFAVDFLRSPIQAGTVRELAYLPFAALAVLGPILRISAWVMRSNQNSIPVFLRRRAN